MSVKAMRSLLKRKDKGAGSIYSIDTTEKLLALRFREMLVKYYVDQEEFDYLLNTYLTEEGIKVNPITRNKVIAMLLQKEMPVDDFRVGLKLLQIPRAAVPTQHGTMYVSW